MVAAARRRARGDSPLQRWRRASRRRRRLPRRRAERRLRAALRRRAAARGRRLRQGPAHRHLPVLVGARRAHRRRPLRRPIARPARSRSGTRRRRGEPTRRASRGGVRRRSAARRQALVALERQAAHRPSLRAGRARRRHAPGRERARRCPAARRAQWRHATSSRTSSFTVRSKRSSPATSRSASDPVGNASIWRRQHEAKPASSIAEIGGDAHGGDRRGRSTDGAAQAQPRTPFAVAQTYIPIAGTGEMFPVRRIYCIGRNYAAHAREMGSDPELASRRSSSRSRPTRSSSRRPARRSTIPIRR